MPRHSTPTPWHATDVTFIEVRIAHPTDRRLRVEFDGGVKLVIARADQIPLAARLIETLRDGKEAAQ